MSTQQTDTLNANSLELPPQSVSNNSDDSSADNLPVNNPISQPNNNSKNPFENLPDDMKWVMMNDTKIHTHYPNMLAGCKGKCVRDKTSPQFCSKCGFGMS